MFSVNEIGLSPENNCVSITPSVLPRNVTDKVRLVTFNGAHLVLGKIRGDGGK